MECKNCATPQRTDFKYCPNCGAKVIRNRLTIKNLWYDVTERYFNLDNTFLKTFRHMFTKPQAVIESYITGVRRKYLNPISYLGIALTLSGIFLFMLRKFGLDHISFGGLGSSMDPEVARKIMTVSLDFNSFVFLLYIPIVGMSGWLIFNKKAYNFSEHAVGSIYSLAHLSIFTFPINVAVLFLTPDNYMTYSFLYIALMALYCVYVLNRLDHRSILRSILFFLLFGIGFLGVGILLNIIMLLTGALSFEDLIPKKI